jgi:hypothetical protein
LKRFSSAGWQIIIENLCIYANPNQPIDAVINSPFSLIVELNKTLVDRFKKK